MKIKTNSKLNLEPLKATCFQCQKFFTLNYNPTKGMYSQKNYWHYWVDPNWNHKEIRRKPENERGKKVCDNCLRDMWINRKWELVDQIGAGSKRQTLRSYIYHNII